MTKRSISICLLALFILVIASGTVTAADRRTQSMIRVGILNSDINIVRDAIKKGADVNYMFEDYTDNPLDMAICANSIEIVKLLLENGANPNVQISGNGVITSTPLLKAVSEQNLTMIKLLVDHGADVNFSCHLYNQPDKKMTSPLIQTIVTTYTKDSMEIFDYLLQKGADINYVTAEGDTPLIVAADGRKISQFKRDQLYKIAEILLVKGANKNIRNNNGKNATDIAIESGFYEMGDLLRQKRFNP